MTTKAKKILITTETHEFLFVKGARDAAPSRCPSCGCPIETEVLLPMDTDPATAGMHEPGGDEIEREILGGINYVFSK